jgi:hypothetical protein
VQLEVGGRRGRENVSHPTPSQLPRRRVIMAAFNRERVEHALNELVVRIVPEDAHDDEELAEERLQNAFDFALDELTAAGDPSVIPDVNHIASLIDSRSGLPGHSYRLLQSPDR